MFTDEGFKCLIAAPDAAKGIRKIFYGYDTSKIIDLNPPKNINKMQTRENTTDIDSISTYNQSSETVHKENFSQGKTYRYDIAFYNSYNALPAKNYAEVGWFSQTNILLYYEVVTNIKRNLLFVKSDTDSRTIRSIRFNVPFLVKDKPVTIKSDGVDKDFLFRMTVVDNINTLSLVTVPPRYLSIKNANGTILKTGVAELESYDLINRSFVLNLIITLDSSVINKDNYLFLETVFGCFNITCLDPITEESIPWPLSDGEALNIPIEFNLGDA